MPESSPSRNLRPLLTLTGHTDVINDVIFSPAGDTIVTASDDCTVRLWNTRTGEQTALLEGHTAPVTGISWMSSGNIIASASRDLTIRLWGATSGNVLRTIEGPEAGVFDVEWSPAADMLASGSGDHAVHLWEARTGSPLAILHGHTALVTRLAWAPNAKTLASASVDTTVRLWEPSAGYYPRVLRAHGATVTGVAWSADGRVLASASADTTIRLWDPDAGRVTLVLEGHTDAVTAVHFTDGGRLLMSRGADGTIRLWRVATGEQLACLSDQWSGFAGPAAAHPTDALLAWSVGEHGQHYIRLAGYDGTRLIADRTAAPLDVVARYCNAKVVLVGDTGVGKTGLSVVLEGKDYRETGSTHGRRVVSLSNTDVTLTDGAGEQREIVLWDLAGQPGYRIIHQLHLKEVVVALIVFDSRSETDPFSGVKHWDRALRQAQLRDGGNQLPLVKFLVAARSDRGRVPVSKARLDALLAEHQFDGYFETSARDGTGLPELRDAIQSAIDWDALPRTTSNRLFAEIKAFLREEKAGGRLLTQGEDLYRALAKARPDTLARSTDPRGAFYSCVARLESAGVVRMLSFGNLVLLQPELLDAYASAMVEAAREEPDGLGFLAEEDAMGGRFAMSRDERVSDRELERLLLIATVEELLRHELAFKEETAAGAVLVFPAQLTRELPETQDIEGRDVEAQFEGPVLSIYTTLIVRLVRSDFFTKKDMWKNAVTFAVVASGGEGTCGIYLTQLEEGRARITVFFSDGVNELAREQFRDYVRVHLDRKALPGTVHSAAVVRCPNPDCAEPVPERQVRLRKEKFPGQPMDCPICGAQIRLDGSPVAEQGVQSVAVARMDRAADRARDQEMFDSIVPGKRRTGDYDVFLCYNSEDRDEVTRIHAALRDAQILPWLDVEDLRPGEDWLEVLGDNVARIKAVAIFAGAQGLGPWQDQEVKGFLRRYAKTQRTNRSLRIIPVILPSCARAPDLPAFLEGLHWVDYRNHEPDPFRQLVWGITGSRYQNRS